MICAIPSCGTESGSHVICVYHRRNFRALSKYMQKKILVRLHDLVCERDRNICRHCEVPFPRKYVCADHFPVTKGSDVTIKFDVDACVCSCMRCNLSNAPLRRAPILR